MVVEPGVALSSPALVSTCEFWDNGLLGSLADRLSGRGGPAIFWTGSVAVIWGGNPTETGVLGPGALYDPVTDTWKEISRLNEPATGYPIWTGSAMLVFDFSNSANSRRF